MRFFIYSLLFFKKFLRCVVPENIHQPTKEDFWKFQGGHKGKVFKEKYGAKLEFPEGRFLFLYINRGKVRIY